MFKSGATKFTIHFSVISDFSLPHFNSLTLTIQPYWTDTTPGKSEIAGFAPQAPSKCFDDDGRLKRRGTVWTASAHIITAVIGSGVLSLAWATAQLGWIAGLTVLFLFSFVTYYTSCLLADCYRCGDPLTGKRNYTYMEAAKNNLGGFQVKICGFIQYLNLVGVAIGYTIAASISMM
ncbi:amino acid transporter, transmembrane [Tanacetum coccineum]